MFCIYIYTYAAYIQYLTNPKYRSLCSDVLYRELVISVLEDCVDQLAVLGSIMPVADKPSAATDVSTLLANPLTVLEFCSMIFCRIALRHCNSCTDAGRGIECNFRPSTTTGRAVRSTNTDQKFKA